MNLSQDELQRKIIQILMGADMARDAIPGVMASLRTAAGRAAAVELLVGAAGRLGRAQAAGILEAAAKRLRERGPGQA